MTVFRLLDLPLIPAQRIIRLFELEEIHNFSQSSAEMRNVAQMLNKQAVSLSIRCGVAFYIAICFKNKKLASCFPSNCISAEKTIEKIKDFQIVYKCLPKKFHFDPLYLPHEHYLTMLEYVKTVPGRDLTLIFNYTAYLSLFLNHIGEGVNDICLKTKMPFLDRDFKAMPFKAFKCQSITVETASWVTNEILEKIDFVNGKFGKITIDGPQLGRLLKKWKEGSHHKRMETFSIETIFIGNIDEVFKGLDAISDDPNVYSAEQGTLKITRNDGKVATVIFDKQRLFSAYQTLSISVN